MFYICLEVFMKKFLAVFVLLLFAVTLSAEQKSPFAAALVKRIDGVTAMVSGLDIHVKTDADSLKNFVTNDFYKAFNIGKNVEPKLFRAVNIDGTSIYKFVPFYKGIRVDGVYTVLMMRDGKIDRISNGLSDINIDITKMIPENVAIKSAMTARKMKTMPKNYTVEKIIIRYFGKFIPAYKIRFSPVSLADSRYHIVDAITGRVIKSSHSTYFDEPAAPENEPAPAEETPEEPGTPAAVCDGSETDTAKIWKFNPNVTPELEEVDLLWVAPWDDRELADLELSGSLITERDEKEIRKIKAYNCPDDGTKTSIDPASFGEDVAQLAAQFGITEINAHICHPMPLANKCENGSFIYDDCESGHEFSKENMTVEKIDRCAEISMYYHASKIYNYVRSIYSDIDSKDGFYLQNNDKDKPLNVISNFTIPKISSVQDIMPMISGENELAPFDNAFFTQEMPMLNMLLKDFGISGDLLVFGQTEKADMGYDGDVVYHEFGHATIYTAGIQGLEYADRYGMTVEPGSLHEGMADTFAFIMTDNTCTGEYASEGFIKANPLYKTTMDTEGEGDKAVYCMRSALNKNRVFEDFVGEVHWDGKPLLASNWEIYQLVKGNDKDTQKHRDNLMKLMLKALYSLGESENVSYKLWAETLMAAVEEDDNFKGKAAEIRKILEDRNFFEEVRARSVNEKIKDTMYVPAGGEPDENNPLGDLMGSSGGIPAEDDGKEVYIGPAYIQLYYDVPADTEKNAVKISATVKANASDSMLGDLNNSNEKPNLKVYYRKSAPIEYTLQGSGVTKVEKDGKAEGTKEWIIPNVEKGARYYIQFVDTSVAAAVSLISAEPTDAETADEDSNSDDDAKQGDSEESDDGMSYDDDKKDNDGKKSSGGCSLVF